MRKLTLIVIAICTVWTGAWAGQVKYTVTDLGSLGGTTSYAYGINNSGQVVGEAMTSSGDYYAFVYSG